MDVRPARKIAEKMRNFRKVKGLSQQALADLSGVALRTIQDIEAGNTNPNIETLSMLDDAGVPVAELFGKTLSFADAQKLLNAFEKAEPQAREQVELALGIREIDPVEIASRYVQAPKSTKPKTP